MRVALSALAAGAVAAAGAAALWWGTDGGRAFTSEAARRLDIAATPRQLPDVGLIDRTGTHFRLSDYRGAPVVVEFVYASCPDICVALGSAFERLDTALPRRIPLVSISFDPADGPEELGWFADRHRAIPPRWRVAGVADNAERAALLATAEVVVISDGAGGFVHNAGLYLVDAGGRLTAVFDPDDADDVVRALGRGGG